MDRPTRDEYYMSLAWLVSLRSTCLSRKVGCVIVKDDNPISTGFNGPARGVKHCEELGGCRRRSMPDYKSGAYLELCPGSHAEQNAIAFAAKNGISLEGATIYVNTYPCKNCMNSIINSGIKKIVFNSEYDDDLSHEIVSDIDLEIMEYEGKDIANIFNNAAENIRKRK